MILFYERIFDKKRLKENKDEVYSYSISFGEINKPYGNRVKHKDSSLFMSKIVKVVKYVIQKSDKGTIFQLVGTTDDKNIKSNKLDSSRVTLYHRLLKKFVKPENIVKLNDNQLMFLNESRNQLRELNIPSNVSDDKVSNVKLKYYNNIKKLYNIEIDKLIDELNITDKYLLNDYIFHGEINFNNDLEFIFFEVNENNIKKYKISFEILKISKKDFIDYFSKIKTDNNFFNRYIDKYLN